MEVRVRPNAEANTVLDRRARRLAESIVKTVQGTSGLEAQAIGKRELRHMVEQTVHELMAGSKNRLWEE